MSGWVGIVGSLAVIAIVITVFGLMLGLMKPADASRRSGAIVGFIILLLLLPAILIHAWAALSLWQQIALAGIGLGLWLVLRPQRRPSKRRGSRNSA